ncbi:hypothetical protein BSKO_03124 [Bryopsis sp. KO-2023]|nr:hypothetical protein BSKO_03124 [Bryopsis sp. KO-2023]
MSVLLLGSAPVRFRFGRRSGSTPTQFSHRRKTLKLVCSWCNARNQALPGVARKPALNSQENSSLQIPRHIAASLAPLLGGKNGGRPSTLIQASAREQDRLKGEPFRRDDISDLSPFDGLDKYFTDMEQGESDDDEGVDPEKDDSRLRKKRGRKRGSKMDDENKKKIKLSMKGKNTYRRSEDHKKKIGEAMRLSWQKRRESGKRPRTATVKCSLCGKMGHNRRTCPMAESTGELNRTIRLCGYCQKPGHNRRSCPDLEADMKRLQKERLRATQKQTKLEEKFVDSINKKSEKTVIKDVKGPIPVPIRSEEVWEQALGAAVRAWQAGVKRQRMEVMLPMLKVNRDMDPSMGWPGGIKQQFKVATPLAETILKGLKTQEGLGGRLKPKILNDVDVVAYWKSDKMAAILFPQPDSMDTLLALGTKSGSETPDLMLMINPQWQPGQVISDFGFGVLRKIREDFVDTFEDVFFMKRISVFSDVVLILRSYPFDWQVHFVHPSGDMEMIGMTRSRPSFVEIQRMLKDTPGAMTSLNWIDKLQQKYSASMPMQSNIAPKPTRSQPAKRDLVDQASVESFGRQDLPADGFIPDSKELDMWGESMNSVDVSRTVAQNAREVQVFDEVGDRFDIVTGKPVRDLMRDPVTQFRSFFDVFGGEEDRSDFEE